MLDLCSWGTAGEAAPAAKARSRRKQTAFFPSAPFQILTFVSPWQNRTEPQQGRRGNRIVRLPAPCDRREKASAEIKLTTTSQNAAQYPPLD